MQPQSTLKNEENKGTLVHTSCLSNSHGYCGLDFRGETSNIVWAEFDFLVCILKKIALLCNNTQDWHIFNVNKLP